MSERRLGSDLLDKDSVEQLIADMRRARISSPNDLEQRLDNVDRPSFSEASLCDSRSLDSMYRIQLQRSRERNRQIIEARKELPAYDRREEILNLVNNNRVMIISGETGCGKTTQVPQYILDDFIENNKGSECKIVCTQPRKISVLGISKRVAQERGERCGRNQSVGYQIRLDRNMPRESGSIVYCTTGVVLQWLKNDPNLMRFTHVIVDEVHERNLETDFLITVLRDVLKRRPNLKVIMMSATIESNSFSKYFGNCPVMTIPGRTYPVQKYTLEDVLQITRFQPIGKSVSGPVYDVGRVLKQYNENFIYYELILSLLKHICSIDDNGAVLIFLPGLDEINNLYDRIIDSNEFKESDYLIIMLHSMISMENQQEVFSRPPPGIRKIVISTNIAETGITIEDVVYVIDSGKMRMTVFDQQRNVVNLCLRWISKSNAKQRAGRAGRLRAGKCYQLFTSSIYFLMPDSHLPEIARSRLENLCLKIKSLNLGDIREFLSKAMDRPNPETIKLSIELLKCLNAFDNFENLTPLGEVLSQLPLDPHLGKMLLFGAIFSCLNPTLTIVAVLDYKNPFYIPKKKQELGNMAMMSFAENSQSDHIMFVRAFDQWENASNKRQFCRENCLVPSTLKMLSKQRRQLANEVYRLGFILKNDPKHPSANKNSENDKLFKGILCAGLYPNVAFMNSSKVNFTTEDGEIRIHPKSIQFIAPFFDHPCLVYYVKMKTYRLFLYDVTVISPSALYLFRGTINPEENAPENDEAKTIMRRVRETMMEIIDNVIRNKLCLDWQKDDTNVKFLKHVIEKINSSDQI